MSGTSGENRTIWIASALVLAVGIIIGGYLLGDGIRRARMADRAVTVRGLAEHNVTADLATWTIVFSAQGNQLDTVQRAADRDADIVMRFFRDAGFPEDAVRDAGISASQYYDSSRSENIVTVRRRMQLRTNDIARAQQAFARQADLLRAGVALEGESGMIYNFTRLNDIKPRMIAEATRDARRGAQQFAQDSGTEVGGIRSATQGYFSITARDGDEYEGSGRDSPYQKVRVVTTIEFYLD